MEQAYSFYLSERWCRSGNGRIFCQLFLPDSGPLRRPLVILSHELGVDHRSVEPYARQLAAAGYGACCFDFCGGTVGGNRSDGDTTVMSIATEAEDLTAVLNAAADWDFVDPDRIVLLGASQGGVAAAMVAGRTEKPLAGLVLLYPALSAFHDIHARFAALEDVPETFELFDGWIRVGRNYAADIWDMDWEAMLTRCPAGALLLHGNRDKTVDLAYSRRAAELLPECRFCVIDRGGHGFYGRRFEAAMGEILEYLRTHLR